MHNHHPGDDPRPLTADARSGNTPRLMCLTGRPSKIEMMDMVRERVRAGDRTLYAIYDSLGGRLDMHYIRLTLQRLEWLGKVNCSKFERGES